MARIQNQQETLAQAVASEKARADRGVIVFISALVFFHVAISCMVVAKAMVSSKASVQTVAVGKAPAR